MTISRVRCGVLALCLAVGGALVAQPTLAREDKPFVRVNEAQARAALAVAAAAAKTNRLTLKSVYEKELRKISPDFTAKSTVIYERAELTVTLIGPAQLLLSAADDRMGMEEPLTGLPWAPGPAVYVGPNNENAPNVVRVVVTRDEKEVPMLSNGLSPKVISPDRGSGAGRKANVHEGTVSFPSSAFDLGATVVVSAVLDSGRKLSRPLIDRDLRKVQ